MSLRRSFACALLLGCALLLTRGAGPAATAAGKPVTLLAAGDIASCSSKGDEATAALLA